MAEVKSTRDPVPRQADRKRTSSEPPILTWALSIRNSNPELLDRCLSSVRDRTPDSEIVIVDNMSGLSETIEVARRYADVFDRYSGPQGNWTEDDHHTSDMSASRQHAFSLASGRWVAWIDDDDRLPGPDEVETLLKLNNRWKPTPVRSKVVEGDPDPISLEDLLLKIEEANPEVDMIWCPYLYCKDKDGKALVWQERERIMKRTDPPKWNWKEAAHEILVPIDGYVPKGRVILPHLLFVHEKEFDEKAHRFAIERHFDVLLRQYEAGDGTTRRCIYLAAYSATLCPEREREFIDAAHRLSVTHLDRCRSMMALGNLYAKQGLLNDALEAFSAATALRPDLPDPWITGAEVWVRAEDWNRAADWLQKGISCEAGQTDSQINPRFQAIRYPVMLSEVYGHLGKMAVRMGVHDRAVEYLSEAASVLDKVLHHEAIGDDRKEAENRLRMARNILKSQQNAIMIGRLVKYLVDNDEPSKAVRFLQETVPWNLQDHPIIVSWKKSLRVVDRHMTDVGAYLEFYKNDDETGYIDSPESWLDPAECLPRVHWMAQWINEHAPYGTILDVGCFDGIVGIPLLALCPNIRYVGIDVYERPVERFSQRLRERGLSSRTEVHRVTGPSGFSIKADVAIWSEVIEHVQSPLHDLMMILECVKDDGFVLITTPWGSFDFGHPPEKTNHGKPRDSRGHLRAFTPRDLTHVIDTADVNLVDLTKWEPPVEVVVGHEMRAVVRNQPVKFHPSGVLYPLTVVVPGALWDWNGRTLDNVGMGASEKSIVQFSSALSAERQVEVYGPVPCEDVYKSVRYWPREQLYRIQKDGKVVVSRNPAFWSHLRNEADVENPLLLWLQDAWYPELDPETASKYEKIIVVSEWHKKAMHDRHGVPLDKMEVIYNPVDAALYQGRVGKIERKRDRFIYCSSPDRGLIPLLKLWPHILEKLPDAELIVTYGWRGCEKLGLGADANWTKRYEAARRQFESLRHQKGVVVRDMVNPREMAELFLSSSVWAYPTIDFEETCCASALEARAAGCVPVAPPIAALAETAKCKQGFSTPIPKNDPEWEDRFVEACIYAANTPDKDRLEMSEEAISTYRIEAFLPDWNRLLDG